MTIASISWAMCAKYCIINRCIVRSFIVDMVIRQYLFTQRSTFCSTTSKHTCVEHIILFDPHLLAFFRIPCLTLHQAVHVTFANQDPVFSVFPYD
jgi:hypothetical protein